MSAHHEASLVASVISMLSRVIAERTQVTPQREHLTNQVSDLIDSYGDAKPDETCWELKPMPGMYDVYLELREAEGTIVHADLIRGGLVSTDFSSGAEFVRHNARIHAHRKNPQSEYNMKACSACGKTKERGQFPRKGGSKCKRCVDANTRDRKALKKAKEAEAVE